MENISISAFLDKLSSKNPVPGGGSASALLGAVCSALLEMVLNLSINSSKYLEFTNKNELTLIKINEFKNTFLRLVKEDELAYKNVSLAYLLPKLTQEQIDERNKEIINSLKEAILPPSTMIKISNHVLSLIDEELTCYNLNCISDLGVSLQSLKASINGAYLNVLINYQTIKKILTKNNLNFSEHELKYKQEINDLIIQLNNKIDKIYQKIVIKLQ